MPSLRLVVLFDGTDNKPEDSTNVWRTFNLLAEQDAAGVLQKKKYVQGVGTDFGLLVQGSIFGSGIQYKIREGYEWLARNYQDNAEIYVFGFSRGAFAARSLIQMIATCGLATESLLETWSSEEVFARYEQISKQASEVVHPIWRLRYWQRHPQEAPGEWRPDAVETRLLDEAQMRQVRVRMAGLWDTVGAIGKDAFQNNDASRGKSAAHNVRPTRAQEYGYHALAIDENRPMFQNTLWRTFAEEGQEDIVRARYEPYYEQRWFIGAHADVGGGYRDGKGKNLPDISLNWMMQKALALGLAFSQIVQAPQNAWEQETHDSFKSFLGGILNIWDEVIRGDQRLYREIRKAPRKVSTVGGVAGSLITINETIDDSVVLRWKRDTAYRPPGLVRFYDNSPPS